MEEIRIGRLAERCGVTAKTIRYYEARGLMPEPDRTASGQRVYRPEDVRRLGFVKQAQTLGFSLEEIREILEIQDGGRAPCPRVRELADAHVRSLDERIEDLMRLRADLEKLRRAAGSPEHDPRAPSGFCHLIDSTSAREQ